MEKKIKVVSVDFDGVVIDKIFGKEWLPQKKSKKVKTGISFTIFGLLDKWWGVINHLWRRPVAGSLSGLRRLKNQGYKIVLLTSRYDYHRDATLRWLKKWGFYDLYDEFYFNNQHIGAVDSKLTNMKIIRSNYHIDDNLGTVEALASTFKDLTVFYLTDNQYHSSLHNIKACSWAEINL